MRISNGFFALFIVLAALTRERANAATYYVDRSVSASGNGTSWGQAWRAFSAIEWARIKPGDTIYISGGSNGRTYGETLTPLVSGQSGKPVIIARAMDAGHDGPVTIDGGNSRAVCVNVNARSFLEFRKLKLKNCTSAGFQIHASRGITVRNSSILALSRGFHIWRASDVILLGNTVTTPSWTTRQTDGIYSQESSRNRYARNTIVISNGEPNGHNDGIQSNGDSDVAISGNYVEQRNQKTDNAQGIFVTDAAGAITVANNIVYGPKTYDSLIKYLNNSGTAGSLYAYNNTLSGGRWGVIQVKDAPGSKVYNNVIYTNAVYATGIAFGAGRRPAPSFVNYNLYFVPNGTPGQIINHAVYSWSAWRSLGYEMNGVSLPRSEKDSIIAANFSPARGSKAIDAGAPLDNVTSDYAGRIRPAGAGQDIGAYEGPLQ